MPFIRKILFASYSTKCPSFPHRIRKRLPIGLFLSTIPSLLPLITNTHEYRWNHLQFLNHPQHMLPPHIHKKGGEAHATLLSHRHQLLDVRLPSPPPAVEQPPSRTGSAPTTLPTCYFMYLRPPASTAAYSLPPLWVTGPSSPPA